MTSTGAEIYAKDLTFEGGRWKRYEENNVEVAELVTGQKFKVTGKYDVKNLAAGTKYDVAFVIKMMEDLEGWEDPVILKLDFPAQNRKFLKEVQTNTWQTIPILESETTPDDMVDQLTISLSSSSDTWKNGIVIKKVTILPTQT